MTNENVQERLTSERASDIWFNFAPEDSGERTPRRNLRSQMRSNLLLVSDDSSDKVEIVSVSHAPGLS